MFKGFKKIVLMALAALKEQYSPVPFQRFYAIFWILLWSLVHVSSMTTAKLLSPEVNSAVVLFMRCFFGLIFFLPFFISTGWNVLKTKRVPLHFLRSLFVCCSIACTYYAHRNLPLATATSIGLTTPLMITLLAHFILKDVISKQRWILICLGYICVLIIVQPQDLVLTVATLVALAANFFASNAHICVKKLTSTESRLTLMAYVNVVTLAMSILIIPFFWQIPSLKDMFILMTVGALGSFSQFCYISALMYASPSFVAPFEYTRLIFAIPVGVFLFSEWPTLTVVAGSILIIFLTYLLSKQ